jgi:hypothetical protein
MAGCRAHHAANFAFRHPYVSHLFLWVVHSISKAFSMVFTMMMYFIIVLLIFLYGLEDHELWNIDIVLGTSNWIYVMMPI